MGKETMSSVKGEIQRYSPLDNDPVSSHQVGNYGDVHLQGKRDSQEDGSEITIAKGAAAIFKHYQDFKSGE